MLNAPALAGASDWYLVVQLRNFRNGSRGSHVADTVGKQMAPMAKALVDDTAVADLVAYTNALVPAR